jgi:hypothetical protein
VKKVEKSHQTSPWQTFGLPHPQWRPNEHCKHMHLVLLHNIEKQKKSWFWLESLKHSMETAEIMIPK